MFCIYYIDDLPASESDFIKLYRLTDAEMSCRREAYGDKKWYFHYWKYVLNDGFFVKIEAMCKV